MRRFLSSYPVGIILMFAPFIPSMFYGYEYQLWQYLLSAAGTTIFIRSHIILPPNNTSEYSNNKHSSDSFYSGSSYDSSDSGE